MKKRVFILMTMVLLFTLSFATGCKKNQETEGVGYGLVHKDYVGIATMKVKKERVTSLSFEEVFLPSTWAQVTAEDVSEDLTVLHTTHGSNVKLAKYLLIGDKKFTGTATASGEGENQTYTVTYSAEGIADLKAYVQASEENAKWYAEALLANKAKVADATFKEATFDFSGKTKGFTKTAANYWPEGGNGLGWKKNMQYMADALVGTKMDAAESKIVKEGNTWTFDGVTSQATLTDALDYYKVAQRAYKNATK